MGEINSWAALHMAAADGHLDVTRYLISQGAEANKGKTDGLTALHSPARNGHLDVTKYLISQGAEVNKGNNDGGTALHLAAENGHLDVTKYLISQGVEVNKGNNDGWTALHLAAENGHLDVTKYLISQKSEVNKGNHDRWTALHSAAQNGHLDVTKYLISQGAEVKKGNNDGWTTLHLDAGNGHLDVIKYLISQGAEVNKGENDGWTALHLASQNGHLDVTKYLISQGSEVNKEHNDGRTALHSAAKKGHLDVTKYLISQGAEANKGKTDGLTALHSAAQNGHLDVTKYLISQGSEVNKENNDRWTALHLAAGNGHLDVTEYLISQGAYVNMGENDGWTALHLAAQNGHLDVTKYLTSQGANANKGKTDGRTALHSAAQNGHLDVTKYLISQGAEVNKGENDGWTALHLAGQNGHLNVSKYLISLGAGVNKQNNDGWTALHLASQNGDLDFTKYLISQGAEANKGKTDGLTALHSAAQNGHLDVTKYLISLGAELNKGTNDGRTALHLASQNGHLDVIKYLVSQRAEVNKGNNDRWTALHLAAGNGHLDVIRYLISQGAEVNKENNDRWTALHLAAGNGHFDVIRYLISQGAEVNKEHNDGWTALHIAAMNGRLDVTKYLTCQGAEVSKPDSGGYTAIIHAAVRGHVFVSNYLLKLKSDIELAHIIYFTELHACSEKGDLDAVKNLVNRGAQLDRADTFGWTALHIASMNGHLLIVDFLLSQGAKVNASNSFGVTALHKAAEYGHKDVHKCLLKQGADLNRTCDVGWSTIHFAIKSGKVDMIEHFISQGAEVDSGDVDGMTPLHQASLSGYLDIATCLLRHGADVNKRSVSDSIVLHFGSQYSHYDVASCSRTYLLDVYNLSADRYLVCKATSENEPSGENKYFIQSDVVAAETALGGMITICSPYALCDLDFKDYIVGKARHTIGCTPLDFAVKNGRLDVTRYLVSKGADVNDVNNVGWTALHFAAQMGNLHVVDYLLREGSEINRGNVDDITPLHVAAFMGHSEITTLLLSRGADVSKATTKKGSTALHVGAQNGHLGAISSLLSNGADVNKADKDSWTSLHIAAQNGHLHITKILLSHHAVVNQATNMGSTALHLSAANGHADVTRYLVEQGAETSATKLNGRTALHLAATQGHLQVTSYLAQGIEVNRGDRDGYTPLHLSALKAHLEVAEALLNEGARVDVRTSNGQTSLHLSSREGHANICKVLSEHASMAGSLDQRDEDGLTAVHLAIQNGHSSVVETLVCHGADLNIQSTDGKTCLHEAVILSNQPRNTAPATEYLHENEGTPEKTLILYLLDHGARTDLEDDEGNLPHHYARDETIQKLLFSMLPTKKAIDTYREQEPLIDTVSVDVGCDATELELKHHGISMDIPQGAFRQNDSCNVTLSIVRDLPSVDVQDDESVACYGVRCDPPNMIFHRPVKIRIPYSTVIINPNQVAPDIVTHVWDSVKDLPKASRKRSSSSAEQPPHCRMGKKHLELYIDHCAEWWVLIPLEQQVIRHQLLCTPYIPDTIERGREVEVHFHVHADVPGTERVVLNEERQESYRKAHRSVPISVASHWGDVTVTCECEEMINETKVLSLKEIRSQMRHKVQLTVLPSETDPCFQVITIAVTQAGERGVYRSMSFVLRYEDEVKGPEFSPVIREIEGDPHRELSDVNVLKIAENLSIGDYYDLGVALGFPIAQLDAMEYKRLNDRQQAICDMLMQWKQRQSTGQNTKEMLLSLVKSAEREAVKMELTDVTSTGEISEQILLKVARHIKWADFNKTGTELGFSRTKLDNIKHKALQNRKDANIQMLSMWKSSQRSVAKATETLKCIWESVSSASRPRPNETLQVPYPQTPVKRVEPSEPVEPEDMDIIADADTDEKSWNVDQCGSIPSTEELCSVALPVKSFSLVLALEKALRLNDDVMVGLIDLPISSALQKIARQVIDSWRKGLRDKEREDRFAQLLSKYKIQDVKEGSEGISKRIQSKTDLLELCGHLNMGSSDILQFLSTSLTFPSHMIRRNTIKMLGEWVRQGGTRERLLEITQAFRFNDAAAEVAEVMKTNPGCTSLFSHTTVDHKGGELSLLELGITVSIPEGAIPKGMGSVVTLQVRSQGTPRIPLQDGELLISPVVECSLTQELFKPATVALPHCTNRRDLGDGSTVMLYTKIGPGTFGRRKLSSSTSRGFHISKETIKFRTRHLQVWALSTASVIGVHLSCATFQPILIASAEKPSLRVYVVNSFQYYAEVIQKKEKTSSVPYCQVTDEFKFSIDPKAGDLKILCNDGSKKTKRMVPMKSLLNGKCKPLDYELQFSPEETGKKTVHLTILQGLSMRADKELTISLEVEPAYGVDITDPQGRLQYVSDNLLEILSDVIHTPRDTQSLGYHLGFSHSTVDQYLDRADSSLNHVSKSGFGEMLRDWRRRVRPSEQVDELHLAMRNAGLGHAAEVTMHELSSTSRSHFAQVRQEWEARK